MLRPRYLTGTFHGKVPKDHPVFVSMGQDVCPARLTDLNNKKCRSMMSVAWLAVLL